MQEAIKNVPLYLRHEQKAASREKRGYLMPQLNSHQKTIGTWTLLCAKKQKIPMVWKVSSWALGIRPHFKYLLNAILSNRAIEPNLFCQEKVKNENSPSLCILLFCVTMTDDFKDWTTLLFFFFFSCMEVSDCELISCDFSRGQGAIFVG